MRGLTVLLCCCRPQAGAYASPYMYVVASGVLYRQLVTGTRQVIEAGECFGYTRDTP